MMLDEMYGITPSEKIVACWSWAPVIMLAMMPMKLPPEPHLLGSGFWNAS